MSAEAIDAALQEYEPIPDPFRVIHDMHILGSPETVEAERRLFQNAMANVQSRIVSPDGRRAAALSAEVTDWLLFGTYGSVPPKHLEVTYDRYKADTVVHPLDAARLSFHPDCPLDDVSFQTIHKMLNSEPEYRHLLVSRHERVNLPSSWSANMLSGLLSEVLEQTPTHRFLASLDMDRPVQPDERPLTLVEQRLRENQVEKVVRDTYGSGDKPITRGTPAGMALASALYPIDLETTIDSQEESSTSSLRRIQLHFLSQLDAYIANHPKHKLSFGRIDQITRTVNNVYLHSGEQEITLGDISLGFARNFVERLGSDLPNEREVNLVQRYVQFLFNSRTATGTDILRMALAASVTRWQEEVSLGYTYDVDKERLRFQDHFLEFKRPGVVPREDTVSSVSAPKLQYLGETKAEAQVASKKRIGELEREKIGVIERGGHLRLSDASIRLLMMVTATEPLPPIGRDRSQLCLRLDPTRFNEHEHPYIPGFVTVGHDPKTNRFTFLRDPEGDPYDIPHIPLPPKGVRRLIDQYRSLGLEGWADALSDSDHPPTVKDLVALIAKRSLYFIPKESDGAPTRELKDFLVWIRKGIPLFQCTGANTFCKLSLETAFDEPVGLVSGLSLVPGQRKIDGQEHCQVMFRGSLLDATPHRVYEEGARATRRNGGRPRLGLPNVRLLFLKDIDVKEEPPEDTSPSPEPTPSPQNEKPQTEDVGSEITEESSAQEAEPGDEANTEQIALEADVRREQLQRELTLFEATMTVMFEVNAATFYKNVHSLGSHDPLRMVTSAVRRAAADTIAAAEIKELRDRLIAYTQASDELKKKHKIDHYDSEFYNHLMRTLGRIAAILR